MKELDFAALAKHLTQSEFVCQLTREGIGDSAGLLTFLQSQPTPYFNYVLCVLDDDVRIHPVYVGCTNDLPGWWSSTLSPSTTPRTRRPLWRMSNN